MEIQSSARKQGVSVAEWVRQALRKARADKAAASDAKMRRIKALAEVCRDPDKYPSPDIDVMLKEIDMGRSQGWSL